jgi:hypothetical protein
MTNNVTGIIKGLVVLPGKIFSGHGINAKYGLEGGWLFGCKIQA